MLKSIRSCLIRYRHRLLAIGVLVLSTWTSLALVIARWALVGNPRYAGLVWDLFLAWIPFWISVAIYVLHVRGSKNIKLLLGLGIAWLLFFPNAPYLLTEFGHLGRYRDGPYWCDLVMMIGFAWNGLMLGLLSLFAVHKVLADRLGACRGWLIAVASLLLCSYGISLGRFERFNSWNVVNHPLRLLGGVANQVLHPENHLASFATAVLFCAFLSMAYLALCAVVRLNQDAAA